MGASSIKVLLVDDEPGFLDVLDRRLGKRGLVVTLAQSGEQALEALERAPVDVVVLDVKMPGLDGLQTLREVKRLQPLVEVILLTGHASVEVAVQGMELGAFDYLMKPVDLDALTLKLEDASRRKSLREQETA